MGCGHFKTGGDDGASAITVSATRPDQLATKNRTARQTLRDMHRCIKTFRLTILQLALYNNAQIIILSGERKQRSQIEVSGRKGSINAMGNTDY